MQAPPFGIMPGGMPSEAGSRRRTSIFSLAAEIALWIAVVWCPLALGGAPVWALWPFAILAGVSLVLASVGARRQGQGLHVPLVACGLLLGAALCALQLIPLPGPLLGVASPPAAELRDFALLPLGLDRARPISLDPPATWRALALHLGCASALLAAAQLSRSRRARRRLVAAVALTGGLVAAIGYAHQLLDVKSLFGLHAFRQAQPPLLTTFGNPNHLAGFLLFACTLMLGLAVSAERRQEGVLWAVGFVATGPAVFLSLSRGGMFFFVAAQVLLGAFLLLTRKPRPGAAPRPPSPGALQVLLGTLAVVAVSAYLALEKVLAELSTADTLEKLRASKIELWPMMAQAALRFWRAGMGRGAFEAGFSRFQTMLPGYTFSHPENAVLQLWAEFGLVAGLAVLGLYLAGLYRVLRRGELNRLDLALVAGAVALALHNLVDFSLELPACAAALCVALGVLSRPGEREERRVSLRLSAKVAVPAAGAALAVALVALVAGRRSLEEDEARLNAALAADAPLEQVRALAIALIDAHPADHLPYAAAARAYARKGDPRQALAFVNRALFLRPLDSDAHRTAARALLRLGRRGQAFAEYQLAANGEARTAVLAEAVAASKDADEVLRLTPPEPDAVVDVAERLWNAGRRQDARDVLDRLAPELPPKPESARAWLSLARVRSALGQYPEALAALDRAEALMPASPEPVDARADTLWAMGKQAEAVALLEQYILKRPGSVELSFALAEKQLGLKDPRRCLEVLVRANPFVSSTSQRSRMMVLQAQAYEAMGRPAKALDAYQSASRLQPDSAWLHYTIARLYESMGKHGDAAREVREGMRHDSPQGLESQRGWLARLEDAEKQVDAQRRQRSVSDEDRLDLELLETHAAGAKP